MHAIPESKWAVLRLQLLNEASGRVAKSAPDKARETLNREAYWLGQLIVAGELSYHDVWWHLQCAAHVAELNNFIDMVHSAFRACEADFEKHFGAGLPYDG